MAQENVLAIMKPALCRPPSCRAPLALDPSNRMAPLKVPITTYRHLREHLSKLGDPPTGYVRVYRGQTKDYGSLLPSGLRSGTARRDPVWHYWSALASRELLGAPDRLVSSEAEAVWIEAIAQHYGPGSTFLDVTRSLDVALWFALHEPRPISATHEMGPDRPLEPVQRIPLIEQWWEYQRWSDPELLPKVVDLMSA
jgi:FRG domain